MVLCIFGGAGGDGTTPWSHATPGQKTPFSSTEPPVRRKCVKITTGICSGTRCCLLFLSRRIGLVHEMPDSAWSKLDLRIVGVLVGAFVPRAATARFVLAIMFRW